MTIAKKHDIVKLSIMNLKAGLGRGGKEMDFSEIDYGALTNEYAEDEMKKWHFLKPYPYDHIQQHILLPLEEANSLVAEFEMNHHFLGCFDIGTGESRSEARQENCRYFKIGKTVYDMYDPESILSIPIPESIAYDFEGIPGWYEEEYRKKHNIPEREEFVFLSDEGVNSLIDRAKKLYKGTFSKQQIQGLRELFESETETNIPDEEILFWIDFTVLSNEEFLVKHPMKPSESTPEKYESISNGIDPELYEAVVRKGVFEYQRELITPLTFIAVNLYVCNHDELAAPERLIAQLFASGEEEYARYLDEQLSTMAPFWNRDNTILYGETLREWCRNSYEYYWLQNYFPEQTPKSKGAYTTAKRKRSKRYLQLKEAAEAFGFVINEG